MPDKSGKNVDDALREEALQALRTFEHILEIMPDDQGTLEAVIMAAGQCGETEKARNARMHLVEVLTAAGQSELAKEHLDALRADEDPRARSWVAALDMSAARAGATGKREAIVIPAEVSPAATPEKKAPLKADISGEIDLAWKLLEAGEITQEDYATLVKDITEMSAGPESHAVSLLHALESSHHKRLESILAYISQASRAPFVSLACFSMRADLLPFLGNEFIVARGALVYEIMGKELLVGLLNPLNATTRDAVTKLTGRTCHFYTVRASEFEEAHKRLRESAANP